MAGTPAVRALTGALAQRLTELLALEHPPVAVSFRASPPPGVSPLDESAVAGCVYWPLAQRGAAFYTGGDDHLGCPLGAYVLGVPLGQEALEELRGLLESGYPLQGETADPSKLPRRKDPFGVAVYAPLESSPLEPDVVLLQAVARAWMLLEEAWRTTGREPWRVATPPACSVIPLTLTHGRAHISFGCAGSRSYAGLGPSEAILALPGRDLEPLVKRLETTAAAHRVLESFHRSRRN